MLSLTFIVAFILCLTIAVFCCLIAHELVNTYQSPFLRYYFYYILAFCIFAIYSFWGQIGMQALISSMEARIEVEEAATGIMPLIGFPFFIIAMIMVIRMAYALVGQSVSIRIYFIHLGAYLTIALVVLGIYLVQSSWSFVTDHSASIVLMVSIESIYFILFTGIIVGYLKSSSIPRRKIIIGFTLLFLLGLSLRIGLTALNEVGIWIRPLLLLLCFLSPLPGLWYIRQQSDLIFRPIAGESLDLNRKKHLFEKYRITRREQEVIEQICLGKTNQQIADTLFISLQTVKDHTHRIYTKVGINNRMKLVRLVNG